MELVKTIEARFVGVDNSDLRFFEVITNNPEIRRKIPYIINEEQMGLMFLDQVCKIQWNLA